MTVLALSALQLNVVDHDRSVAFFRSVGFVEDYGARPAGDGPTHAAVLAQAAGIDPERVGSTTSLTFPQDPFMHLEIQGWKQPRRGGWPRTFDQLGGSRLSFLVDDVESELARLRADGVEVLLEPRAIDRRWGPSQSALVRDPDGNFVELLEVAFTDEGWDTSRRSVTGAAMSFLHFQVNTDNPAVRAFYNGFGFEHDTGPDMRPGIETDLSAASELYERSFGFDLMPAIDSIDFLRLPTDHSHMHLEIMNWKPGQLLDPAERPTFRQRGVMRVCFKVKDDGHALQERLRAEGARIYQEDVVMPLNWGDSWWCMVGDPDGNVTTFEQWFPARSHGHRM